MRHGTLIALAARCGQSLPVAIVIGANPLSRLVSQAVAPLNWDEVEMASALNGRPLETMGCVGNEPQVPVDAEFVLEDRISKGTRVRLGSFDKFTQCHGARAQQFDTVTRRERPTSQTIFDALASHQESDLVFVVNEYIDILHAAQVQRAVVTRFRAATDLVLIDKVRASRLDPTAREGVGL